MCLKCNALSDKAATMTATYNSNEINLFICLVLEYVTALELSSYLLEIPNNACTNPCQILIGCSLISREHRKLFVCLVDIG